VRISIHLIWLSLFIASCSISLPSFIHNPAVNALDSTQVFPQNNSLLQLKRPTETAVPSITPTRTTSPSPIPTTLTPTSTSTSTPLPPFNLCSPLDVHSLEDLEKITSDPYNPPAPGKDFRHHGIDFSHYTFGDFKTIQGIGVQTILPGIVASSIGGSFPFGNMVIVETPYEYLPAQMSKELQINPLESLYTLYAHMEETLMVTLGEQVLACSQIGTVGRSGNAGIFHLHLETRVGKQGAQFPVMGYYLDENTAEEKEFYLLWRTSGEFRHFDPMLVLDRRWVPNGK